MADIRQVRKVHNERLKKFETKQQSFKAITGDHNGTVEVPGRPGYIYVRDWVGIVHVVFNTTAPVDQQGYVVWIVSDPRNPGFLFVQSMVNPYPQSTDGGSSINPESLMWPGPNTLWIQGPQILPALVTAIGGMNIAVYPFYMHASTNDFIYVDYQEFDLTSYVPAAGACWAVVSAKPDGTIDITTGNTAGSVADLVAGPIETDIDPTYKELAAVALFAGMDEIVQNADQNMIADLRWTSGTAGSTTGVDIEGADADTPLDADKFPFWDVVDAVIKSITWANIKATLKTYFDTLYSALGHTHAASVITNTPAGTIASTDVQAAINELDSEKSATGHTHEVDQRADMFNDSEGNPADVIMGSAVDGTSTYAARRDHVHHFAGGQYRQFVTIGDGAGGWEFVTFDGDPLLILQDLE